MNTESVAAMRREVMKCFWQLAFWEDVCESPAYAGFGLETASRLMKKAWTMVKSGEWQRLKKEIQHRYEQMKMKEWMKEEHRRRYEPISAFCPRLQGMVSYDPKEHSSLDT